MPSATSARFDEDGLRDVESVNASNDKRRERENSSRSSVRERQDALRADFAAGTLSMAEYAKLAREAGITAKEVGAALQERASAEKRMEEKQQTAQAAAEGTSCDELAAALAAKAQGLERLKRGATADAADAFEDAAALAARAAAALADGAPAVAVRLSSLLNAALCHLKLDAWSQAEAACTAVLAIEAKNSKALYRRGTARLRLARPADALADLEAATALTPSDKEIERRRAEARKAVAEAAETAPGPEANGSVPASDTSGAAAAAAPPPAAPLTGPVSGEAASRQPDLAARSYCYLEVSIGGHVAGRMSMQLFDDLVPRTCANFRALCRGVARPSGAGGAAAAQAGAAETLCYRGSPLHRIVRGFCVQGGDVVCGDGTGGVSALDGGGPFADESFTVPHARPGVLSMANMGQPHSNGCQFFFTLAAAPECDGKHVAFGRLLSGMPLLRRLEALPTDGATDRPIEAVAISDCGELDQQAATALLAHESDSTHIDAGSVGGGLDQGGEALLHAAMEGDLSLMRELLDRGVTVDAFGSVPLPADLLAVPAMETAAHSAARAVADGGVGGEADADAEPAHIDCAALAMAARMDHVDMLTGLLASKADPDLVDSSGRTALHWAALAGSARCAQALLDSKADVALGDGAGRTPAHLACAKGHAPILAAVLRAAPNAVSLLAANLTPLHIASAADFGEGVDLLVAANAEVNGMAVGELSPVHLAAARGALGALHALISAGASIDVRGARSRKQPLHAACEYGRALAVGALLAARADATSADAHGSTPLHWACRGGAHDCAAVLLNAKADVSALTKDGSACLHLACEAASPQCTALLLRAKADHAVADGHGVEPIHAASAVGSAACVGQLLAAGANANARLRIKGKHELSSMAEAHSKTALFLAAEHGHVDAVRALLAANADVAALATIETQQQVSRTSPLWAARRGGHVDVCAALEAAGAEELAETVAGEVAEREMGPREVLPKIPVLV